MPAVKKDSAIFKQYSVVSVEKTRAPAGADGDNWFKYVVERDNSQIVGNMRGTLNQVTKYARDFVDNLNLRAQSKKGYSHWVISPSQKTPPSKA
ncbi:MAG: hypothetical protein L0Z73_06845 [Gammaproteobacteria bacterium]|nr:hypothetical protein [Gammaproteobacteria bacterium]